MEDCVWQHNIENLWLSLCPTGWAVVFFLCNAEYTILKILDSMVFIGTFVCFLFFQHLNNDDKMSVYSKRIVQIEMCFFSN